MIKDFCPFCGARFKSDNEMKMLDLINKHFEDESCKNHFRPLGISICDEGQPEYKSYDYNGVPVPKNFYPLDT